MTTPLTLFQWLKTRSGKVYATISGLFTLAFTAFQVLKLFGIERLPLPTFPTTNQGWLTVNFSIQVAFIAYVVLFTAYKYSGIKDPNAANPEEETIWQNLELHDPHSPHHDHKGKADQYEQASQQAWVQFKQGANKVVRQFTYFWFFAWLTWLAHYLYLLTSTLGWVPESEATRNFVNNLNSLMFIFLFMTLTVSTRSYGPLFWARLVSSVLGVYVIEWLLFRLSHGNPVVALTFTAFSGLFASVALAAFVGSINSKFINIPIWLVPALYLYAAIQAFYVFLNSPARCPTFRPSWRRRESQSRYSRLSLRPSCS